MIFWIGVNQCLAFVGDEAPASSPTVRPGRAWRICIEKRMDEREGGTGRGKHENIVLFA